jgi:hypothetical protein
MCYFCHCDTPNGGEAIANHALASMLPCGCQVVPPRSGNFLHFQLTTCNSPPTTAATATATATFPATHNPQLTTYNST